MEKLIGTFLCDCGEEPVYGRHVYHVTPDFHTSEWKHVPEQRFGHGIHCLQCLKSAPVAGGRDFAQTTWNEHRAKQSRFDGRKQPLPDSIRKPAAYCRLDISARVLGSSTDLTTHSVLSWSWGDITSNPPTSKYGITDLYFEGNLDFTNPDGSKHSVVVGNGTGLIAWLQGGRRETWESIPIVRMLNTSAKHAKKLSELITFLRR